MTPIIGKKVILFPLAPTDLDHFVELHRGDKNGYMQRLCLKEMNHEQGKSYVNLLMQNGHIIIFTVITKEGKASRRGGYIYISDFAETACTVSGIMDTQLMIGLARVIRRDKYTFSQDAIITLINWIFSNVKDMHRIQTEVVEKNRLSLLLSKKCGFKKEGILREYLKIDDRRENVVILSYLKSEWENELRQKATGNNLSEISGSSANRI